MALWKTPDNLRKENPNDNNRLDFPHFLYDKCKSILYYKMELAMNKAEKSIP